MVEISTDINEMELLQYAISNGMLNVAYVQEEIQMHKRDELIKKHPYKIWEGNDGNWHTYLPDSIKGRIPKKRKTKELIQELIYEFWREQEENPSITDVFEEWIEGKMAREDVSKSTYDRYKRQYEQCFTEFGKRKIKSISEADIETFILDSIHDHELSVKAFSNLRTLIFGIFKYSKRNKYVSFSITELIKDIEISKKSFTRKVKTDEEQVFTDAELPIIQKYLEDSKKTVDLGLLIIFKTGVRIGELAALKWEDVNDNLIHINRTEISYEDIDKKKVIEVRDFPKSEAGIRDIVLPDKYLWILKTLRSRNPFNEYVFSENGVRMNTQKFRNRLRNVCKAIDIVPKSPHKARKTYGTILLDSHIDESLIINQMGHTDISCTKKHYYYNRKDISQKVSLINSVAGL